MIGREYLRVSVDRTGKQKSQDEQHDDNLAAAPSLGIDRLVKPYRDTGSASTHARKRRDAFDRLLADLAADRFGADALVLWESSRGSRKVGEWVELIESCETVAVKIMVTMHGRLYDPANPRDRRSLLEDAVDGEFEVAKSSARIRRNAAAAAVEGLPHGRTPFGYRRTYDPVTRRLVAQEPDPAEAPVVVELFTRVAGGHSLSAIAKDFEARGIRTRKGGAFSMQTLRGMLLAPVYVGRRVHTSPPAKGKKRPLGAYRGAPEFQYDGTWPALVTDEVFYAVKARLNDPARTTTRPGRALHLLSMIARCDVCGGPLGARYRNGVRKYQCRNAGHVHVDADELDAWVETEALGVLTAPDVVEKLTPEAFDDAAVADARGEVERVRAEHTDLVAQVGAGKLSPTMAAGAEPGILARLAVAENRVQELVTPPGLRNLIEPGPEVVAQWEALPMAVRREVVKLLFAPNLLGVLSVASADGKRPPLRSRIRVNGKALVP